MNDREEWICANIGLVHACAKRFTGRGMEYDDLFQAGCMGLVKAADGFDESRGLKFSTYAVQMCIRDRLNTSLTSASRLAAGRIMGATRPLTRPS